LDHERKVVVKFVVLSATTGNAKGKSVSLQHVANVMRSDNIRKKGIRLVINCHDKIFEIILFEFFISSNTFLLFLFLNL
jgi:hypothetical protein